MNGPTAQLVAVTCHANAFLRGQRIAQFFPGNSTCKFCDRIWFVETKKGEVDESVVARSPDDWFTFLRGREALGVRIVQESQNHPLIPDRMSNAFAGGGGEWLLCVRYSSSTDYWRAHWAVWNQKAPQQRIWRVTYELVAHRGDAPPRTESAAQLHARLTRALEEIEVFARTHDQDDFAKSFRHALECLRDATTKHGYHRDLLNVGSLPPLSAALLDAAQSASVFGGMGSWNDIGFDGADGVEYERVSEQLFTTLNEAICAAANETDST